MKRQKLVCHLARQCFALALAASLSPFAASAKPVMPVDAPIPRLLTNVSMYVKQNPDDPNGYYTLGRIHYFAFAAPGRQTMPVTRFAPEENKPQLPASAPFGNPGKIPSHLREGNTKPLNQKDRKTHIQAAIRNLKLAIQLELRQTAQSAFTRRGLSELTLACVYEEGKADAGKNWREEAVRFYRLAYDRSLSGETKQPRAPIFGIETLVSHEAANSYLRLVKQRGVRPDERKKVAEVEKTVQRLASLPRSNVVTPIVFPLDQVRPLSSLVISRPRGISFDLDGSGRAGQMYSAWPRKNTGILVWDPTHTGRISSGRQLFGNATWWIFWENGYRALQSLDDNRDGWLTGSELQDLGVWIDKNSNARCDSGEVRPVTMTGITGFNVRDVEPATGGWVSRNGISMKNGTILPTYDWIAKTIDVRK